MPRIVATHTVNDVKHWASKGDERVEIIGPFATEIVSYVAADGSNQVAVSANIHNVEGLMAWMQSSEAAAAFGSHGVIPPVVLHNEAGMDHTASIRRLYDLINAGDIDGFGRQLADDFVERDELPGIPPTKAGVVQYFQMLLAAFPDLRMDVEDVIAGGDKAVARVRVTGTNKGEFMGMPATGKSVSVNLIDITRFGDDGLAREHWGVVDQLALMQQLGVIPAEPPA
jgi:steroid delta-isomerase-like uncharacterized protein